MTCNENLTLKRVGFFGFPVLVIFEIGFSVFALKIYDFGIHCGFRFFPFLIFGFRFLSIKKYFFGFVIRLSSS